MLESAPLFRQAPLPLNTRPLRNHKVCSAQVLNEYSITCKITREFENCRFCLKTGIDFAHFGLESGMVFEGTTEVYDRIYSSFNSK